MISEAIWILKLFSDNWVWFLLQGDYRTRLEDPKWCRGIDRSENKLLCCLNYQLSTNVPLHWKKKNCGGHFATTTQFFNLGKGTDKIFMCNCTLVGYAENSYTFYAQSFSWNPRQCNNIICATILVLDSSNTVTLIISIGVYTAFRTEKNMAILNYILKKREQTFLQKSKHIIDDKWRYTYRFIK